MALELDNLSRLLVMNNRRRRRSQGASEVIEKDYATIQATVRVIRRKMGTLKYKLESTSFKIEELNALIPSKLQDTGAELLNSHNLLHTK